MNTGGYFGADKILHFDGGLFDNENVLPLDSADMDIIADIDALDWGAIEPSIFGTLFERGLDPSKRSQLGAHYTSKDDILLIVEPVLMAPLRREWEEIKEECRKWKVGLEEEKGKTSSLRGRKEGIRKRISEKLRGFADKIAAVKVLDPACGSGNFLYVALRLLLDLQNEVINFSDEMGAGRFFVSVTPAQLHGIEFNEYAYELAQMTIQIGYIQWLRDNGYGQPSEPILKQVKNILHMDAVLAYDENGNPIEPKWPEVDIIIGNPPFLGGGKIRSQLGSGYTNALFRLYSNRLPNFSDLCCYWFEKARAMIEVGKVKRAGLLATNSIRGGANRKVLERIKETGDIFWAQSDRDWVLDGAAVNVSMVGFDNRIEIEKYLDNRPVDNINPNLTGLANITQAKILEENSNISFQGPSPKVPFDIDDEIARYLLAQPNINNRPNSDVVKPVASAIDLVQGSRRKWTIYFEMMPIEKASQYEAPFEYVKKNILPIRQIRRDDYRGMWWQYARPRPEMTSALRGKKRFIATPRISKHRIFVWLNQDVLANDGTIVFARDDDYFFGILHSRIHEIWALKQGTSLEDRPRYTPTTSFETFPFPWAPGAEPKDDPRVQAIAQAAKELIEQRDSWLNADLTPRPFPTKRGEQRTLTNLGRT